MKARKNQVQVFVIAFILAVILSGLKAAYDIWSLRMDAVEDAQAEMEFIKTLIDKDMQSIEQSVHDMSIPAMMMVGRGRPDSIAQLCRSVLEIQPGAISCMAVFRENYYPERGPLFSVGAEKKDGVIITRHLEDTPSEIDFFQREWYTVPKEERRDVWTDAYYAPLLNTYISTFSHPLISRRTGDFIGVFYADMPLQWLQDRFTQSKLSPESEIMLLNDEGIAIASSAPYRVIMDNKKRIVHEGAVGNYGFRIVLSVPKNDIYSHVRKEILWTVVMVFALLLLFTFMALRAVKNVREAEQAKLSNQLLDKELNIAHDIQMGMVPAQFPPFPDRQDLDIYALMRPAKDVGGDFYDYFIRDEKLFFCIGDVSGKGVPASLLMATTRTMFRTMAAKESNPQVMVSAMNSSMKELGGRNMFVTLFLGILDLPTGRMQYCNAGHNPPVIIGSQGAIRQLEVKANLPVGAIKTYDYRRQEALLQEGDTLFVYTDGVTEAQNPQGELMGIKRMLQTLLEKHKAGNTPKKVIEDINNAVLAWESGAAPFDDTTMLAIRYTPVQEEILLERTITLSNDKKEIQALSAFFEAFAQEAGMGPKTSMEIQLALEEMVTNVIVYAYVGIVPEAVKVTAQKTATRWIFCIKDKGKAFDPTSVPDVSLKQRNHEHKSGGLGIFLVRKLMDTINYQYRDEMNILTLTRKIAR